MNQFFVYEYRYLEETADFKPFFDWHAELGNGEITIESHRQFADPEACQKDLISFISRLGLEVKNIVLAETILDNRYS